jgi:hypothetical protein
MSALDQLLNKGPFSRVRRNHALEHATLAVLAEKNPRLRMAGYSDPRGFWLVGEIETDQVREGVHQALNRLRGGEHNLAIHPHCGTNLVTAGFLAGAFAWLGMLGAGRSARDRFERLPLVISLVTLGMMVAQPLGPKVQERVTTSADPEDMQVTSIERVNRRGDVPLHRVLTHS